MLRSVDITPQSIAILSESRTLHSLSSVGRTELTSAPYYLPDQLRFLSSLASKILLYLLNSRNGDIPATYTKLAEATGLGRTSVYKGLKELQVNRLLWVVEVRNSHGQVSGLRLRVQIPPEYFPPEAYASKRDELEGHRRKAQAEITRLTEEIARKEAEVVRLGHELVLLDRVAELRVDQTGS